MTFITHILKQTKQKKATNLYLHTVKTLIKQSLLKCKIFSFVAVTIIFLKEKLKHWKEREKFGYRK